MRVAQRSKIPAKLKYMLSEIISPNPMAAVMIIFGGSPNRRHDVLNLIKTIDNITAYGVLSFEEGMQKLRSLKSIQLVLIGGRYDEAQRIAIKEYIADNLPGTLITEPGLEYPYNDENIKEDISGKLQKYFIQTG